MKIRVTLKDPDALYESVDHAVRELSKPDGVSDAEWKTIKEDRAETDRAKIAAKWMKYSEYLTVEFDTESGTATVIETKDSGL